MTSGHASISTPRRTFWPARARLHAPPELLFFAVAYLLYLGARWVFAGDPRTAVDHAQWIVALEQSAHIAVEGSVQQALGAPAVSWLLSNVYLAAQLVVLPGALVLLYRRARPIYRRLRTTVIATWMLAVPIHGLWPVAPPRLADLGIQDTVSEQLVPLSGHSTIFYNAFAAVPSLHVGFAFAVSFALAATLQARWARALALLWGPLVTLAVIATGNHFVFDAVAGLVVTLAGFAVGVALPLSARRRAVLV
jgi:hypothetical protein